MSVEWYGDEVLAKINAAVEEAVVDCALDLKSESIKQAPIDLGDLRGNCSVAFEDKVISPAEKGESLNPPNEENTAIIGYTLNYAKKQHEELDYNHPKGGKAKYLEDPLNENNEKYTRVIADAIKEATT